MIILNIYFEKCSAFIINNNDMHLPISILCLLGILDSDIQHCNRICKSYKSTYPFKKYIKCKIIAEQITRRELQSIYKYRTVSQKA